MWMNLQPVMKLAQRIDKLMHDYDPYEYMDYGINADFILNDLETGKANEYISAMEDIADEPEYETEAREILAELKQVFQERRNK